MNMNRFSQIMPLNSLQSEVKEFAGYITALDQEFYIHVSIQTNTASKRFHLQGCKKFKKLVEPVLDTLEHHMKQSNSLKDMLSEVTNILEKQIQATGGNKYYDFCAEYGQVFEQVQDCGWENVHYLSADLDELHLKAIDASNREHILKVFIPKKFPKEEPKFESDLPQEFVYKWFSDETLKNVFHAFKERLTIFAQFWDNLDEIDEKTWVLEPENPRRKDCKRRIALASGVSLLLVIDPLSSTSIPTCHYMGPERSVEPFREKFNKNMHTWSEFDTLLHNLHQVLEMEFPSPITSVKEEFCMECAICYSYLLGEEVPNMTCDNLKCNQSFHHTCLYEYIRMLPDVKSSFNKLFGQCPYCNKPMWCSIP